MSDFPGSSTAPWAAPEATGDDQVGDDVTVDAEVEATDAEVEADDDDEADASAGDEGDTPVADATVIDGRSGELATDDDPIPTDEPEFDDDGVVEDPGADLGVIPKEQVQRGYVDDYMKDPERLTEPPKSERTYAPGGDTTPPEPDKPTERKSDEPPAVADAEASEATGVVDG